MKPRTYGEAGVDVRREQEAISTLVSQLKYRRKGLGSPMEAPGFFTALLEFEEWILTLNTDGVGTKLLVAEEMGKWDTVGIDCVAMNVNDTLCAGAEPIAMVDYFAVEKYDEEVARQIGTGLDRGAEMANITIVGGELATIPEIVKGYDLVGTCLGFAPREGVIDGSGVRPGHVIVGIPSSGLHSNGFTLVRKLLRAESISYEEKVPGDRQTYGEALLRPTEIYVKGVLRVLRPCSVSGMAHITGGGFLNIARVRKDLCFEITDPFDPQPIFQAIQDLGQIDTREMYTTFNMGLGFVLIIPEEEVERALKLLRDEWPARVIGVVKDGSGVEITPLDLSL
jgi:phosphoribosylformylglycinamidine cyclo-ligase